MLFTNFTEINENFDYEKITNKNWLVIVYVGSKILRKEIAVPVSIKALGSEIADEVWVGTRNEFIVTELSPLFSELYELNDFTEPFILGIQLGPEALTGRECFFQRVQVQNEDSNFVISHKFSQGVNSFRKWLVNERNNEVKKSYIMNLADSTFKEFIKGIFKILL